MKRLVTLGITLALVMGLFCFSVSAETVIQGTSDTVTATYGSNDITIALRARKLRVVNTGTAAAGYAGYTPVIVSVTIYNLGNQNCLVNNLKFRLTSESAEYTIAGFENISTDLFISDTAYDANGYLSLKAANEYTYSGGFVVPANTNMTYVGIINVSSNWITENQTWRTVDLSTATFYENLTTTVGDYPCAAEPVDLSGIDTALDDIYDLISDIDLDLSAISTVLTNIYNNLSYSGPDYVFNGGFESISTLYNIALGDYCNINATRYLSKPTLSTIDVHYDSTSDTYTTNGTAKRLGIYLIDMRIVTHTVGLWSLNIVNGLPYPYSVDSITTYGPGISGVTYYNSNLVIRFENTIENYRYFHPGTYYIIVLVNYSWDINSNPTFPSWNIAHQSGVVPRVNDDIYAPANEYEILRDLYIAYSSVNGIDDLSDAASDASDQAAAIHNQEASYYAQNQAAIEATGLSNFQFSGEQSNGIGSVSNDFTALWNALGSWNSVYVFSMTLTLALTILRHVPNRRKPKEKNSE